MGEAVQKSSREFLTPKDLHPLPERETSGNQFSKEIKQQSSPSFIEGDPSSSIRHTYLGSFRKMPEVMLSESVKDLF